MRNSLPGTLFSERDQARQPTPWISWGMSGGLTSVVPPWYLRVADGGTTDVLRRYYRGTPEVPYRRPTDTNDGGRTRGSASDGQYRSGNVTETTEAGQGRDGDVVRHLVLQPGMPATWTLTARALGPMALGIGTWSGGCQTQNSALWKRRKPRSPSPRPSPQRSGRAIDRVATNRGSMPFLG